MNIRQSYSLLAGFSYNGGMAEFLIWTIGIFLGISLTFRFFGKQIMQFALKAVIKRLAKNVEEQSQQYQRNYAEDAFHEHVYVDHDIKVSAPKYDSRKAVTADDIAEDVDFEEIR